MLLIGLLRPLLTFRKVDVGNGIVMSSSPLVDAAVWLYRKEDFQCSASAVGLRKRANGNEI